MRSILYAVAFTFATATTTFADLVLSAPNSRTGIDFTGFTGTGFTPGGGSGQLDSNTWRVTGLSDGDLNFGGTETTGDFARGASSGGETTGGIYAFDTGNGGTSIITLGVQASGADFTPGTLQLRVQNATGVSLTGFEIDYELFVLNDQSRGNSFNFSYSLDGSNFTDVASLDFVSDAAPDSTPVWRRSDKSAVISGLNIANGDQFILAWEGNDVSGSGSRDEFALNNIGVTGLSAIPEPSSLALVSLAGVGLLRRRRRR